MAWLAQVDLEWLTALIVALLVTGVITGVMAALLDIGGGT